MGALGRVLRICFLAGVDFILYVWVYIVWFGLVQSVGPLRWPTLCGKRDSVGCSVWQSEQRTPHSRRRGMAWHGTARHPTNGKAKQGNAREAARIN